MNLFASNDLLGWSHDAEGLAVFFKRRGDYERASNGVGNPGRFGPVQLENPVVWSELRTL